MRKFIVFLSVLLLFATFSGCKAENEFLPYISELRQNAYSGATDGYTVTAFYGFRESPFINDGKRGNTVTGYTFKFNAAADEIQRKISVNFGDESIDAVFKCDEQTGEYTAFIETERYEKSLSATLICGAEHFPLRLNTLLPDGCLEYADIFDRVTESQRSLFNAYKQGGVFNAEIYMRIFIKNGKPYWYMGIASGNERLKAFLADGITGEVLAIREIM